MLKNILLPMIEVKNISKKFGNIIAVDKLSFLVKSGQIVGFLGPNGAGKTTTMRILTGYLSADDGKITIDGIDIEKDPVSVQRKIGYLAENNPLYKNMQVAEFLDLTARLHRMSKKAKKDALDFVVKAVGIEKVYFRPIGELSKGFKQRVGIAAALVHQPKIIIMDEPTEGLDPNQREEIRQLIKKLASDHTILMSTHVMQEASAVCDRLLIMAKGKIIADGTAEELSKMSSREKTIAIEIEGSGVKEKLEKLNGISRLVSKAEKNGRFEFDIILDNQSEIRPELARLVWENKWIIWKLKEQEYRLEEIFQILTKS